MALLVDREAELLLEPVQPSGEGPLVVASHAFALAVMTPVSPGQVRELTREMGKEAGPRRGPEPERRPDHVAGTRLLRRRHQPPEPLAIVGDARDDRRQKQSRVDPGRAQTRETANPRGGDRRAELEPP